MSLQSLNKEGVPPLPTVSLCSFRNKSNLKVFYYTLVVSLASFQYGTTTVFSSPLLSDLQHSNLTQWKEGFSTEECAYQILIGPISPIAAIVGGLLSAPLTAISGLVSGMILTAGVYLSGWTMVGSTYFITSPFAFRGLLLTGRALTGFAIGLTVPIVPVYIAEISPPSLRGRFTLIFQISLTVGLFIGYLLGGVIGYWKASFVFASIGLVHTVLLFTVRRSPIRSRNPLRNIQALRLKLKKHGTATKPISCSLGWKYVKVITVGSCVLAFQQITGLSAILYYVGPVLESAGWRSSVLSADTVAALSIGVVQICGALCCFFFVDRLGRRLPLFFGTIGTTIANIGLAVYFAISFGFVTSNRSPSLNISTASVALEESCIQPPTADSLVQGLQFLPVCFFILFFVSFSLSWASIAWILTGELFPQEIRGLGSGIAGTVNRVGVVIVTFAFPSVAKEIGFTVPFLVFGALSVMAAIFVVLFIPETRNLTLEEIGDIDINMSKNAKQFFFLLRSCYIYRLCKKCFMRFKYSNHGVYNLTN